MPRQCVIGIHHEVADGPVGIVEVEPIHLSELPVLAHH